jgi:hypothetical protein
MLRNLSVRNLPQPCRPPLSRTCSAWIHALLLIWAGICGAANSAGASRRGLGFDGGFDRFGGGGDDDEFGAAFGGAMLDDAFDGGYEDDERAAYRAMGMGMGGMMMGALGDLMQNKKREPPKSYAFLGSVCSSFSKGLGFDVEYTFHLILLDSSV